MGNDTGLRVVTEEEWRAEVAEQVRKEKEHTRNGDALAASRRRLPAVEVSGDYEFTGPDGPARLRDLFDRRSQLIVYHFMFGVDWDEGCPGCSWVIDAMTDRAHLNARDTSIVLVSTAAKERLDLYQQRMGWDVLWYSCEPSQFNVDMGFTVDGEEDHGVSVFLQQNGRIYRTYTTGDRGVEHLGSHWSYLDLTPWGRQEDWEDSPPHVPQTEPYSWIRRHDDY